MKGLNKFLNWVFAISMVVFCALALIIVLVQVFGFLTLNGSLVVSVKKLLASPACMVSSVTAVISFVLGYLIKPGQNTK